MAVLRFAQLMLNCNIKIFLYNKYFWFTHTCNKKKLAVYRQNKSAYVFISYLEARYSNNWAQNLENADWRNWRERK